MKRLDPAVGPAYLGPAHELEELARLAGGLHPRHQLGQRHNLLVDLEDPGPRHVYSIFTITYISGSRT